MRDYTTQMDAAKRGIITPEMKSVAKKEYRTGKDKEKKCFVFGTQYYRCLSFLCTSVFGGYFLFSGE